MRPFQNSLEALALVAVRATGARSYAFIEKRDAAARLDATVTALVEYPLGTDSVAFAFRSDAEALRATPRLDRIAAAMQAIWSVAGADRYACLVERVSDLESRLIDSKIADRVRGLLTDETSADPTDAITRHVDSVLRPTPTSRFLEKVSSDLEDEIEERRLVAHAKQIMQAVYRLSEEQAHVKLRLLSRKSRKSLKDIARQVVDDQHVIV